MSKLPPPATAENNCDGQLHSVEVANSATTSRESNMELLRIIAIIFVLILHTRFDGILSVYDENISLSQICRFTFEAYSIVGVNVFIMISGYYGIKLSTRSVVRYCFYVYYFAFIALLVVWCMGSTSLQKDNIIRFLLPLSHNIWFVPCYFILMLLAPVLNSFIKTCSLRKLSKYTLLLYAITYVWSNVWKTISGFGGYSWGFFIILYFLGAIVRKWNEHHKNNKSMALAGYFLVSSLIVVIAVFQTHFSFGRSLLWAYDSPLVMASSLCLFLFFSCLTIKQNKIINFLAASTFAILLFHMSPGSSYFALHERIYHSQAGLTVVFYSGLVVVAYFFVAVLLDQPRKYISNHISKFWQKERI